MKSSGALGEILIEHRLFGLGRPVAGAGRRCTFALHRSRHAAILAGPPRRVRRDQAPSSGDHPGWVSNTCVAGSSVSHDRQERAKTPRTGVFEQLAERRDRRKRRISSALAKPRDRRVRLVYTCIEEGRAFARQGHLVRIIDRLVLHTHTRASCSELCVVSG